MLSVVATPIGNLGDITLRAIETLRSCDLVVCEDTRVTGRLLQHLEMKKPLLSFHAQSGGKRLEEVLSLLQDDKHVCLVTDAGTPGISDPGSELIGRAAEAGVKVVPIPGASAFLTAIMGSGFPINEFAYLGFVPHKKGRQTFFREVAGSERTSVFYESPHRLLKALESLVAECPDRPIAVARELTKMFEEFFRGTPREALDYFQKKGVKGEFVIIVSPLRKEKTSED